MQHDEFMSICRALGAPARGWQSAAVDKAKALGFKVSQPTISLAYRNPDQNISEYTARMMRTLRDAVASGELPVGFSKQAEATEEYRDPDDDLEDDDIIDDIAARFAIFEECIEEVVCGTRAGCLVSGPPGCGKSHGVSKFEDRARGKFLVVTGDISPVNLYKILHAVKDGGVVVFDDCDGVFADETKLNLLKGALECKPPGAPKWISWLKESRALIDENEEKIEKTFDFQGRVLFMTNIDFEREIERGTKLAPHLDAFCDRSGYMSLGLHSKKRRMLRVVQVCRDSDIMQKNGIDDPEVQTEILDFVKENQDSWRNLNLRLIVNLCQYRKSLPSKWKGHAKALLMKSKR